MGMLERKVIKTATVVSDDVREKIDKDLKEGNFDVVEQTKEIFDPYTDEYFNRFERVGWTATTETVTLRLHSGYVLTIEEG